MSEASTTSEAHHIHAPFVDAEILLDVVNQLADVYSVIVLFRSWGPWVACPFQLRHC